MKTAASRTRDVLSEDRSSAGIGAAARYEREHGPEPAIAQEAAIGFVRRLRLRMWRRSSISIAGSKVRQDFTDDRTPLEQAIRQTAAGGSTSLYNAVYIALKELNKIVRNEPLAEPRRRAIVLLSDGEDTSSLVGFDEVLDLAARSDTAIYAIGLLGPETSGTRRSNAGQFVLRRLTQQTGGRAFFPLDAKELDWHLRRDHCGAVEPVFAGVRVGQPATGWSVSPHRGSRRTARRGGSCAARLLRAQEVGTTTDG